MAALCSRSAKSGRARNAVFVTQRRAPAYIWLARQLEKAKGISWKSFTHASTAATNEVAAEESAGFLAKVFEESFFHQLLAERAVDYF
jgi:hypothetical protein